MVENGENTTDMHDYGQIIKSGLGEKPPNTAQQWIEECYCINYDYQPLPENYKTYPAHFYQSLCH